MDLSFLKTVYQRPGPFASVYADLTRTTEDASKAAELRWRALRADLAAQHTPKATLRAIDQTIDEELSARGSAGLVIFAADGEVVHSARLPGPPGTPRATLAPLPDVLPYLAERGERFPHLLAVVDHRGGEIDWVAADGRRRHIDVRGDEEYPVHRAKAGDWNQSRFQRSLENVWKTNARKVAQEIDRAADRCRAEAVLIAGDTRARTAVLEAVSESVLERTVETDKNTTVDDPGLGAELRRLLHLKAAERILAVAERFDRELANGQRAVAGLHATTEAARQGRVETLLLDADPGSADRLWIGPDPGQVAVTPGELHEQFGVPSPQPDRADTALIRATAATDGALVVVPADGPRPGPHVGAVLRYTA